MFKPRNLIAAAAGALALTAVSAPAQADDDRARDALIGAAIGGLAGAAIGNGDGGYVAAGAALGAGVGYAQAANERDDCSYYRDGRCYRNQGHWERERGINSRDPRWEQRRDYRDWRREQRRERRW